MVGTDEDTSRMPIIRADAWMTETFEDISRILDAIQKGGQDPFVLSIRRNLEWVMVSENQQSSTLTHHKGFFMSP